MKNLLREPLMHFLLIGAGLFLLFGWRGGPASVQGGQPSPQSQKIIVANGDIEQMVETFTRTWQRTPTEEETKGLIESFVRDEIYHREAVTAGLDRDDSVIRRRMRLKMEYLFEDITSLAEPTDEDLRAFLKKHPERYLPGPQIAFRHIYVNADKRGRNAEADALQILKQVREGTNPETVGDPFPLESEILLSPLWDIKKQMGEEFGERLLELKPERWEGPVRSGYGLHLVFVKKRVEERLPELEEVREIVKQDWAAERQKELKDAAYARLRERYPIVMEKPKAAASASADTGSRVVTR